MTHPLLDRLSSSLAGSSSKVSNRFRQRAAAALPLLVILAVAPDCGSGTSATTSSLTSDCPETVPTYSQVTIWPLCTICHSSSLSGSARQGAPSNVNFDTYAAAVRAATEAVAEISAGQMPPPGETQPTSDQITALEDWAQCGTPE